MLDPDAVTGEALFAALLETTTDAVVVFSAVRDAHRALIDFRCTAANDRAAGVLSESLRDGLVGRPLSRLAGPLEGLFQRCVRVAETGVTERTRLGGDRAALAVGQDVVIHRAGDGLLVVLSESRGLARVEPPSSPDPGLEAALLDSLPANITIHHGPEHVFTHSNRAHQSTTGERVLVGRPLLEAMPELVGQGLVEALDEVLATGKTFRRRAVPATVSDETGRRERFYDVAWQPVLGDDGRPEGVATFSYEVTELVLARRHAEALTASLRTSEELFRVSQEVSPIGFSYHRLIRGDSGTVVDLEWVYQNAAASRINRLGIEREVAGIRMLEAFPALRSDALWERCRTVAETGVGWKGEQFYGEGSDGRWFQVTAVRALEGLALTFEDITARKQDERERAALHEAVERACAEAAREKSRLETLLSEAPVAIALVSGENFTFRLANARYEKMVGRTGLRGRTFREVYPELGSDAPVLKMLEHVRVTGETFSADEFAVTFDHQGLREERFFLFTSQRVVDAQDAVPDVLTVLVDITEQVRTRRKAEELATRLWLSEERYRVERTRLAAVLDHVSMGVVLAEAPSGRIVLGNAQVKRILGHPVLSSSSVEAYGDWLAFHPDGRRLRGEEYPLARALAGETVKGADYLYRCGDGVFSWIRIDGAPIRDADDRITGAVVAFSDIDQQKKSELALGLLAEAGRVLASPLDVERTLGDVTRLVVDRMADWSSIYLLEDDGVRLAATTHVDETMEPVLRQIFEAYPLPADAVHGYPRVLRTGRSELLPDVSTEVCDRICLDEAQGALLDRLAAVSALTVPLKDRDRTFGAITIVSSRSGRRYGPQDQSVAEELARRVAVTLENARLFEEARRARLRAEEASRSKDEFLATVSHELRTPLNAILGWAGILRSNRMEPDQQRRGIEVIERNARAQAKLIEDILDAGRIISGKIRLSISPVALEPLVSGVVDSLRFAAEKKGVTLELFVGAKDLVVSGDPDRLRQVVENLLSNALKFTRQGGRIEVRIHRTAHRAKLEVQDDGLGIEPSFLPYVFDRFRQADGSTVRAHGGLGLGLAIVKHLIDLHGGTVRAESPGVGRGSTFFVRLRLVDETPTLVPDGGDGRADLVGLRLLVVDDEPDAREVVATLLTGWGGTVSVAANVSEGMTLLRDTSPDVVISDIGMPGEDGYAFLRRIRAQPPPTSDVPIVALTAYASPRDRAQALGAGFDEWLAKPVNGHELAEVLSRLLTSRRASGT